MNWIYITTICFALLSFFSTSLFLLVKFFDKTDEITDDNVQNDFEWKQEIYTDILIQSNGKVFPGRMSNEMFNFSDALEICSSMNMMMLDKPAKIVKLQNTEPIRDGINAEMYAWINASMDQSYAITADSEVSHILKDFQKKLAIQPVIILTGTNCYFSMTPILTHSDWIRPELHWKRYVYFCKELNNTDEPVFMYR